MKTLFDNAVQSIQLGVEDYQSNDLRRSLSAVRNFYAGTLLLAKEALIRAVPKANAKEIIGANYRPVPDNKGGVRYEQVGYRTIDFDEIGKRYKDFGLPIDQTALRELNRIHFAGTIRGRVALEHAAFAQRTPLMGGKGPLYGTSSRCTRASGFSESSRESLDAAWGLPHTPGGSRTCEALAARRP